MYIVEAAKNPIKVKDYEILNNKVLYYLDYNGKKITIIFSDNTKDNFKEVFNKLKNNIIKKLKNQDKILELIYSSNASKNHSDNKDKNYIDTFEIYNDENGNIKMSAYTKYDQLRIDDILDDKYDKDKVVYSD